MTTVELFFSPGSRYSDDRLVLLRAALQP